ncbi:transposase [Novosphingobium sp. 1748]|uniref:transposase n=1 Tax=Novosphingobium sp. 1748 TaxID=2817760 RepID=UPI00286C175B|nr:transposase [Novosphingobium sp. 1748]
MQRSDGGKGGRLPLGAVMMFKTLILQTLYGLLGAQAEFQILDRRSFGRFLGLDDDDNTPDEAAIWRFREALVRTKTIDALFTRFDAHLKGLGYLAIGGQIMDAGIIAAPRQRMTDEEGTIVNACGIPNEWAAKPAKPAQKERDARWTLKGGRSKKRPDGKLMAEIATPIFGYKSHIGIDNAHGLIRTWDVRAANACNGARLSNLFSKTPVRACGRTRPTGQISMTRFSRAACSPATSTRET